MKPRYEKPPYQPKWMLRIQIFLLRRRWIKALNRRYLIITTTGRKTGKKRSVPIGFVPDGTSYMALNLGGGSNWFRNALANPSVTLEIDGQVIQACAEPVSIDTPEQMSRVVDVYRRGSPETFESFMKIPLNTPIEDLMEAKDSMSFVRFRPI